MNRRQAVAAVAVGMAAAAQAQPAPPDVLGEWWTPGFGARVRIEPCGDAVCGRIVWLWDETPADIADRSPLVGRRVIERMQPVEPGVWRGGRLYNPEDGRDYKGSLHLRAPDRLVVDGCVLFVCQTQIWRRAEPGRCPPVAGLWAGSAGTAAASPAARPPATR